MSIKGKFCRPCLPGLSTVSQGSGREEDSALNGAGTLPLTLPF